MSRKLRTGKLGVEKHLGKSIGTSRKRNLKRIANKMIRAENKKSIKIITCKLK